MNAVANFCFLTQDSNLRISNRSPEIYFPEVEERFPGALQSQWIPMDEALWKMENYREFLSERRKLLAQAANQFLDELLHGSRTAPVDHSTDLPVVSVAVEGLIEEPELKQLLGWLEEQNLPRPQLQITLSHPETGEELAVADAAWPEGLQEGYSRPVAFFMEEDHQAERYLRDLNYLVFYEAEALKRYIEKQMAVTASD